jgi:diaminopimelate epimerase
LKRPDAAAPLRAPANAFFVDLGNPHVVMLVNDLDGVALQNIAMELQKEPQFSAGTNVHVAMPLDPHTVAVRHWERGVGPTMACGSGAIASALVAIQRGAVSPPVTVQVPGGELTVQCDDGNVLLIGPAERVFDTEIELGNP